RLGFNSRSIYAVNDQTIYVLDRQTGELKWESEMPSAVTTAPVADERQIFLSQRGGTITAYSLPTPKPDAIAKPTEKTRTNSGKEGGYTSGSVGRTTSIGSLTSASGKGTGALVSIGPLASALQAARATSAKEFVPVLDWSDASGMRIEVIPLQTA